MKKTVQNIPFLRLSIALAFGIYLGTKIQAIPSILLITPILLILIVVFIGKRYESYRIQILTGLFYNLIFIIVGFYLFQNYNKKPQLYENGHFNATILEQPQEKANSFQTVAEIKSFVRSDTTFKVTEQIIIYFSKEVELNSLNAGSNILFKTNPQYIKNFGNPYEFDYKKYLERKRIYKQVYLDKNSWWLTQESEISIPIIAENYRQKLLGIYKQLPINEKELEILSALTLGYKRDLDPETKRVFSSAGAMHVLAVSGLHVGIIFWIIILLFGYLRKHKKGRIIFTLIAIVTLWIYAFITGLAPSVLRATTMFTIYILGELLYRKSNVYNSLAAAAFILLIINPNNLFETGFQLSFSAVFGIVFLQPKISSIIKVKNKILKFFVELLAVSVAAQLATLPFTLYYFGQFPTYFFITNIIIIPAIMALIPLGISILLVSKITILATAFSTIINEFIKYIVLFLTFIEQLPVSVINISVSQTQQMLLIASILAFFIVLRTKRTLYIHLSLICFVLIIITSIYQNFIDLSKNEFIVYNNPENVTIELIHGKSNIIISEFELAKSETIYKSIQQTTQKRRLNPPLFYTISDTAINNFMFLKNDIIYFEGKTILFENKQELKRQFQPNYIITPNTPKELNNFPNNSELIVTNKRFNQSTQGHKKINLHYTSETTFRKIW